MNFLGLCMSDVVLPRPLGKGGGVLLWRILQWSMSCGKSYSIALKSSAVLNWRYWRKHVCLQIVFFLSGCMILVILCGQISQNSALIVPSMCVAHARVTEHLTKYSPFIASDIARFLAFWALNIFNPLIYFPTNVVYFKGDNMLKDGQMIDFNRPFNKKEQIF